MATGNMVRISMPPAQQMIRTLSGAPSVSGSVKVQRAILPSPNGNNLSDNKQTKPLPFSEAKVRSISINGGMLTLNETSCPISNNFSSFKWKITQFVFDRLRTRQGKILRLKWSKKTQSLLQSPSIIKLLRHSLTKRKKSPRLLKVKVNFKTSVESKSLNEEHFRMYNSKWFQNHQIIFSFQAIYLKHQVCDLENLAIAQSPSV